MKKRRSLPLSLGALLVVILAAVLPAEASAAARAKVVGTDATGDWGSSISPGIGAVGDAAGGDLVKASIARTKKTIDFVIQVTKLPAGDAATIPVGYLWDFNVNGLWYELNTCEVDAVAACPQPPAGVIPFRVLQCHGGLAPGCESVGAAVGELDAGKNTITVPVSRKVLNAVPGSWIQGNSAFGATVYSYTAAPVNGSNDGPGDELTTTEDYYIPDR